MFNTQIIFASNDSNVRLRTTADVRLSWQKSMLMSHYHMTASNGHQLETSPLLIIS